MKSSSVLLVHVDFLSPDVCVKRGLIYTVGYFPKQNLLNIVSIISSLAVLPVITPSVKYASLKSIKLHSVGRVE